MKLNRFKAHYKMLMSIALIMMLFVSIITFSRPGLAGLVYGFVYTREVVTNEDGHHIWVEYNPLTGAYENQIGIATGPDLDPAEWRVMSGDEYRGYVEQKTELHEAQNDLVLMTRSVYEGPDILLADGTAMTKPALADTTASVSILPQARRIINDPDSLIIAEYPINPDIALADDTFSMLHKFKGANLGVIKNATTNRIGFQVAFAKDKDGNPVPADEGVRITGGGEYEAVGPIANAKIEAWTWSQTVSGENGAFALSWYSIPCPGFFYAIDSSITLELHYTRFNPKAEGKPGIYMDTYPVSEVCTSSFFMIPFLGPFPTGWDISTFPQQAIQFAIDVSILNGTAQLSAANGIKTEANHVTLSNNIVPILDTTQYQAATPDNTDTITSGYDFDRDGTVDTVLAGHFGVDALGEKVFIAAAPEDVQGVWLSSGGHTPANSLPDITRVMDSNSFDDYSHQGLLAQISKEDMRNTDIYVVRVSDGKLISERIGLNEYEANRFISNFGENTDKNEFFYTLQIQGGTGDKRFSYSFFEEWQAASGINPDLHKRQADHLLPGDSVRIYAINRSTGYVGHADTVMKAGVSGTDLSIVVPPIIMGPPNLKVRIERDYKINSGATASDDKITQLIGFEGASLTSDNVVVISTEWFDHKGRPMPDSLEGAGYTGRIALLSGDKTLPDDNQGVHQFSIEPGRRLQVLQLPTALSDSTHFYIHISGEPKSGNPIFTEILDNARTRTANFKSSGQNPGILAKRPDNYVPFLVPVFDEATTELQTQAYRKLKVDNPDQTYEVPDPIYKWVYRPEMQFTSYDLEIDKINRSIDLDKDGQFSNPLFGEDEIIDLLDNDNSTLTSNSVVNILYNLNTTNLIPLDFFNAGSDKELVFVIGETELTATLGDDQTITFDNLRHLDLLSPDDYLTIRLYANNDMGNSLWEWAFINVALTADFNRDGKIEFSQDLTEKVGDKDIRTDLNTTEKPYVFWVNNDDDDPESEASGYDVTATTGLFEIDGHDPDTGLDPDTGSDNLFIDGSRDLIDFFAVAINLHGYLSSADNVENNTYLLQHEDEAVNVVYTVMSRGLVEGGDLSSDYLKKIDMSNVKPIFGDWQTQGTLAEVPVYQVTADGIEMPYEFIELLKNDENKGVILVEGNAETTKPLKITVRDENDVALGEGELPLQISEVTKLYRQVSLRDNNRDTTSTKWGAVGARQSVPVSSLLTSLSTQSNNIATLSPEVNMAKNVVLIHGFNVDETSAMEFQNETFKRLYHSGSNQLFTGVGWNGNNEILGPNFSGVNYWDAVDSALYTADDFARLMNGIDGVKTIIAHSLGNMVVGSAIQDFFMTVNSKYFMLNPAVALESYRSTTNAKHMRHPYWDEFYFGADYDANSNTENYTDQNGRRLWSVEWNTLFSGTDDERKTLTWRNRLDKVANNTNVIQYFSSGEEVLRAADIGAPNSFDPVTGILENIWVIKWFIDEPIGFNAWNVQEKSKGTGNLATIGGGSSAGWGFNETCELDIFDEETCFSNGRNTHIEAQPYFDSSYVYLIEDPYFNPFENLDLMDVTIGSGTTGSNAVAVDYPDYLAYEIPALSFAAGGTASTPFLEIGKAINMNNDMAAGWPEERGGEADKEWRHSDFKDIAYRYTYKLFDDLVTKGNLNETQ